LATNRLNGLVIRVDDRLIHGQILYGWIPSWKPVEVWLVDDLAAENQSEKSLYEEQLPGSIKGGVLKIRNAIERFAGPEPHQDRILLIVKSCEDLVKLIEGGVVPTEAHLGNIAQSGERKSVNDSIAIGNCEEELLRRLGKHGIEVVIRDLPNSHPQKPL